MREINYNEKRSNVSDKSLNIIEVKILIIKYIQEYFKQCYAADIVKI